MMGLAFDAVENLKHLYNVDTRRVYLMSFNEGSLRVCREARHFYRDALRVRF